MLEISMKCFAALLNFVWKIFSYRAHTVVKGDARPSNTSPARYLWPTLISSLIESLTGNFLDLTGGLQCIEMTNG
jgi:hypothetical protein